MAGAVIISSDKVWSVGGLAFDTIVGLVRDSLSEDVQEYVERLFRPLDEGCDFISLEDLDRDGFNKFLRAVREQCSRYRDRRMDIGVPEAYRDGIIECWAELLAALEQDPREASCTENM
jgi:hypothetical protein